MNRSIALAMLPLVALAVFSAGVVVVLRRQPLGLQARYYRGIPSASVPMLVTADPILTVIDRRPDTETLGTHAGALPSELFSAVWEGYLLTTDTRDYRFQLASDDGSRLYLDGHLAIDNWGQHETRPRDAVRPLNAGHHRIRIEYQQVQGEARLELRWDGDREAVLQPLEPYEVSPNRPVPYVWQARPALVRSGPLLVAVWSGLAASVLIVPAFVCLVRLLHHDTSSRRVLAAVVGLGLVLNSVGSWWGLPPWGLLAWAPDEVVPGDVLEVIKARFANGWHRAYPPGHYYLLAWLFAPVLGAAKLGLVSAAAIHTSTFLALFVLARMTTVVMAALTLIIVHLVGQELHGPRAGAFAAFVTAFALPFGFYSKVANLDIPYLFWFALSFWFYVRIVQERRSVHYYGYAAAATLAICTKDQAYGLYFLPSIHVALVAWRSSTRAPSRFIDLTKRLVAPVVTAIALFALVQNLAFNFHGFVGHVRILTGQQSSNFRMFGSDPAGQVRLFADVFPLFRWMFGWTGLGLVTLGLWRVWKLEPSRRHWWVFLPVASYYLTFIAVVGFHYDRFWLPLVIVCSLFAGVALDWLFQAGDRQALRRLVAGCAMLLLMWRGLSVDALMLVDSRHDAERWLRANVDPAVPFAYVGYQTYLPRFNGFETRELPPSIEVTLERLPPLVVVNLEFMKRFRPGTDRERWWQWFSGDGSPYRMVFRKKHRPVWSALSYEWRLYTGIEDQYTTLGKINPDIAVFERR